MLKRFKFLTVLAVLSVFILQACSDSTPRILVFTKTKGWHHSSIRAGAAALSELGKTNGFRVDTTDDASVFTESQLKRYRAVVFLNTTGNVLNGDQQVAFERYIQAGGGFVGIHAAADTEYGWPWYNKLVGAYFTVRNPNAKATCGCGTSFSV